MILDTSAMVALILQEPGFEVLAAKIDAAQVVGKGAPSLLECAIVLSSRLRRDARGIVTAALKEMNAQVIPFTEEHFDAAVNAFLRFGKGRHPAGLNFGDCASYAIAHILLEEIADVLGYRTRFEVSQAGVSVVRSDYCQYAFGPVRRQTSRRHRSL